MWISLYVFPCIVCGIATVGIAAFYFPNTEHEIGKTRSELMKQIDWVGGALSIDGITLPLVALQSGGYTHPWRSPYVLCQLIIGVLLTTGFVVWEWKFAKVPMVPGGLFKGQKIVAGCLLISFAAGMNFYSLLNFYPLTFAAVYNPAPVAVGWKGLGYGMSATFGATLGNILISAFRGRNREILAIGTILMTVFGGARASIAPATPGMSVAFGTLAGFGVGILLVPPITVAACAVPDELIATATALVITVRFVGGAVGYSIYYAIFVPKLTRFLPESVAAYAIQAGLPAADATTFVGTVSTTPAEAASLPGVNAAVLAAATEGSRWAYARALSFVWYTSIPFGVIAIGIAVSMPDIRKYMTERVAAHVGRK